MFWIWVRGGPGAILAFFGVVLAFIALFFVGEQLASWVGPVLVVGFFAVLLFVLWRIDPRRREEPSGEPGEATEHP